jgi:hypothetical protein
MRVSTHTPTRISKEQGLNKGQGNFTSAIYYHMYSDLMRIQFLKRLTQEKLLSRFTRTNLTKYYENLLHNSDRNRNLQVLI